MTSLYDYFLNNKKIKNEIDDATKIFNDRSGRYNEEQKAMAYGAVVISDVFFNELKKFDTKNQKLMKNISERMIKKC